MLQRREDLRVISEASDGLDAVRMAQELQPDLILLDIALPRLNGIQAARGLRVLVPRAKILFLCEETDSAVIKEGFRSGGLGYVRQSNAQRELLHAIEAVLNGKQFVGSGLVHDFDDGTTDERPPRRHEMLIYSDDTVLLESLTRFIAAALNAGNPAMVLVTESHQDRLLQKLGAARVDIDSAVRRGTYVAEAAPHPVRFIETVEHLMRASAEAGKKQPCVAICGNCAARLWAEGKAEEAIRLEQISNKLIKTHQVSILCAYPSPHRLKDDGIFESICAEHLTLCFA